ncbi:MAG: hypothetical protein ACAI38_07145 [Myxococcota bacterium]|nr:hypothetical protein [Myxococcota bacterium]
MDTYGVAHVGFRGFALPPTPTDRAYDLTTSVVRVSPPLDSLPLYSSSRPPREARMIASEPEFFRLVVPEIHAGMPRGEVARFADSPELRRQCERALDETLLVFSPEASLRRAAPSKLPDMPLVHEALADFPDDHFAGHALIAVQHLFASTAGMLDALASKGLAHGHMTVIGKSYSTCFGAARTLVDLGVRIPALQLDQSAVEHHDAIMERVVRGELVRYRDAVAKGEAPAKLLVLDEGGHIVDLLHREFPDLLPRVTAVEQTTRGIRRAEKLPALRCALIDVATAPLKLDNEMMLDAISLYCETTRKRTHLRRCGFDVPREVSIIGLGKLGWPTAAYFASRGYAVRAYDTRDIAPPPGVTIVRDREAFFRGAHMLLPITGARPMTADDYDLLPHRALVMNGASSNDEVAAFEAIAKARREQPPRAWWRTDVSDKAAYVAGLPDLLADREYVLPSTGWIWGELDQKIVPLGHAARRAQRDRVLHFADKDIYLAKSGFVLNLTDEEDPIPPKYIQVTRAALALACAQAVDTRAHGRIPLDPERSARLHASFRALVGDPAKARWRPGWRMELPATKPYSEILRGERLTREAPAEAIGPSHGGRVFYDGRQIGMRVRLSPAHVLNDLGEPGPTKTAPSGPRSRLSIVG